MSDFLILDIETKLDPEIAPPVGTPELPLPAAVHHEIVCIGALLLNSAYAPQRLGVVSETKGEAGMLVDFSVMLGKTRPTLVTFNGRGFDLPVIALRCLRHGIQLPYYYQSRDVRYRYTSDGHLDLMDYLSDFGASKAMRLDAVARVCGMPGKLGIDGKAVAALVAEGKTSDVRRYCLSDVMQTAGVFLRTQLLRGELSRDAYLAAMRGLVAFIGGDERLSELAAALNVKRLMLEEVS